MFFSHWHRSCVNTYRRLLSSFVKFEGIISCCGTNCLLRAVGKQSINSKQQEHLDFPLGNRGTPHGVYSDPFEPVGHWMKNWRFSITKSHLNFDLLLALS